MFSQQANNPHSEAFAQAYAALGIGDMGMGALSGVLRLAADQLHAAGISPADLQGASWGWVDQALGLLSLTPSSLWFMGVVPREGRWVDFELPLSSVRAVHLQQHPQTLVYEVLKLQVGEGPRMDFRALKDFIPSGFVEALERAYAPYR